MQRKEGTLVFLISIFVTSLVIANVLATKVFVMGKVFMPAGVIAYPISFLVTDIISELWGKKVATRVVWAGFVASIFAFVLAYLAVFLPPAPFYQHQAVFTEMFGRMGRITFASLIAYLISQTHDVWSFHFFKELTNDKHLWLRNNASTIVSQMIDTVLFISIAFWGIIPTNALLGMMLGQWTVKVGIALLDTPFCYLAVGFVSKYIQPERA